MASRHRLRAAGEDGLDDRLRGFAGILSHLADEPDPQSHLGVEPLARQEVPSCGGSDFRKDERRDHGGDDPEPDLGEAEHRIRPRDGDIRARDEPGAATERVSVDDADDRRRAGVDRLEHRVEAHGVLDVLLVGEVDRRSLPLDVRAGTEARPFTRQHDRASVADVGERVGQLSDERRVERVSAFRPARG